MSVTQHDMLKDFQAPSFWKDLSWFDWGWAAVILAGAFSAYGYAAHIGTPMNEYQAGILGGWTVALLWVGWHLKPMRVFSLVVAALSLFAIWCYGNHLSAAEHSFFLKYFLAGQSAVMWMSVLLVGAGFAYFGALFSGSEIPGKVASALVWSGAAMGVVALMVRWRESYMMGPGIGHVPVSNLYDVFILFCVVTSLLYLYYEYRYKNRGLGGFVMVIVSFAVAFLLWYSFSQQAYQIEALVPALKSYWMKIHVPANFIGYGSFALASMVGVAFLARERLERANSNSVLLFRLPSSDIMDDVMYKSIALGFAFFTLATILGALWAAQAWGGYWSWDPKETWALIVWLNYAAWLHMRLTKGWRGAPMAWWAIIGLLVTSFAFLGVNMFLAGLHSYGHL